MLRTLPPRLTLAALAALGAAAALAHLSLAHAASVNAPAQPEPHYWRQRIFFIPYQPNPQDSSAAKVDKVQLLVARDGSQQWAVLQEAEPRVRGFSYHAAADGEYAFALRMADRRGNVWPEQIAQPLLRIVVDTQPPTLELAAALDAAGQVIVKYDARDARIKSQSLRLEAQVDGGPWQRLAFGPPDVSQADRLLGQLAWRPPTAGSNVRFRAGVEDAAGNPATQLAEASLIGPVLDPALGPSLAPPNMSGPSFQPPPLEGPNFDGPSLDGPAMGSPAGESQAAAPSNPLRSPLEWPASNSFASTSRVPLASRQWGSGDSLGDSHWRDASGTLQGTTPAPVDPFAPSGAAASTPPFENSYTGSPALPPSPADGRTPAQFAADVAAPPLLPSAPSGDPPPAADDPWQRSGPSASTAFGSVPGAASFPAAAPATSAAPATPWVNSLTFDLDYDIQTVGPWGVAKVELWGTKDGGRQWQSLGVDQDNRSPMRVSVPAAGVYGFRIVIDGGNGVSAPTPQPGEAPELVVGVDLAPPRAELRAAEPGQGPLAGHVIIRWAAADENLAARPVGLFYSTTAEGPWTTIATDLDNAGEYVWRLGRETPPRVVLRLEVRDLAGNVEVRQTPAAVDLNLPRPTGRLRNVRPVEGDPTRYRTASGARPAEG